MKTHISTLLLALQVAGATCANINRQWPSTPPISNQEPLVRGKQPDFPDRKNPSEFTDMLEALEAMQDTYFEMYSGTWPTCIDWTAAVMGTHVSATLSSVVSSLPWTTAGKENTCMEQFAWRNLVDRYFAQTSLFYFGEDAFSLQFQAFDDMLWVVLGWLENIKFAEMYAMKLWDASPIPGSDGRWHGLQVGPLAAHRARIFYELASKGWDDELCHGGMNWNPRLTPYKNAITNELFAAASIGMYLYFPGDNNTSPFSTSNIHPSGYRKYHDPSHLENAIKSYKWLRQSQMENRLSGLYQDGFHVRGWQRLRNGTVDPGTGECDVLDSMIYTYNQGVILSASRGLWMATGARSYLDDGHDLINSVIRATGWPSSSRWWRGLGRAGVLEEYCDHSLYCSQDGQTFKGIFFHHLSEFCRPLWPNEEDMIPVLVQEGLDRGVYRRHLERCATYGKWVSHNAQAAVATRNEDGLFGMWWRSDTFENGEKEEIERSTILPPGATDHLNPIPDLIRKGHERDDSDTIKSRDFNDRGRGRTVETQSGGLAVLRAAWNWRVHFG